MTIKDIAEKCGVSVASVSRVINNEPNVSKKLYKKVMLVIDEIGYVPNHIGRQLRTSKSGKILVLLPTLSNPFYSKIIKGIENKCSEFNYGVLIAVINLDRDIEKKYIELLTTKQVDGIISFYSTMNAFEVNAIANQFPYVQCCEYINDTKTSSISIDNEKAAYEAVSYLISLGHKKIAMISGYYYISCENLRESGYKKALKEAKLEFSSDFIIKSDFTYSGGEKACKKLFQLKEPPTAIFAVSDSSAVGAIKYLHSIGKKIGLDVSVIGFDNSSLSYVSTPTISTVAQPRFELGKNAVSLLMDKISDINSINKSVILPHELILRESTSKGLE